MGKHFISKFEFFSENSVSNSDFQWKSLLQNYAFKNKHEKWKTCVFRGGNQVKTLFLRCDVLIEIWFLNKNWNQKLSFWKTFFLQNMIIRKAFYYKIRGNEKFSIQNLIFWKFFFSNFHCAGKRLLQNLILSFSKISFQTLIFNKKVCYKVKAV